jgi:putative membrane protein
MAADATSLAETRTAYASHRTDLATTRTREAFVRTRLAYERTTMAWVRTATSLISFGFTIYKFFQYLRESAGASAAAEARLLEPRGVALVMIALGIGVLLLATIEHRRGMNELRTLYGEYGVASRSLAAAMAILLGLLGLVGLILVFLQQ